MQSLDAMNMFSLFFFMIIIYWCIAAAELDEREADDFSTVVAVVPTTAATPLTWVSPAALASVRITVVDVDVKRREASSAPKLNLLISFLKIFFLI